MKFITCSMRIEQEGGKRLKKLLINCYYTEKYGLVGPF